MRDLPGKALAQELIGESREEARATPMEDVIAAASDGEARRHFTSLEQSFTNLRRGMPGQIPPPINNIDDFWSPAEKALASQTLAVSAVGSPETVTRGLQNFIDVTNPDELIITAHIYDHQARLRSFELVAELRTNLVASTRLAEATVTP